jgi:6-phosphogluconolactonase
LPIFAFAGSLTRPAPNYGAANGRGITSFAFDAASGQLRPVAEYRGIDDTSWLVIDAPRRRLHAICEVPGTDRSWVASFAIAPNARLLPMGRQPASGQTACHARVSPDRRFLIVANYNAVVPEGAPDGAVDVFPVGPNGALLPAVASVTHVGSGPNAARQERAHAHCAMPSPDGRWLYVADLGMDRIVVYALGADGGLVAHPESDFGLPPGTGPRHLVFSADGKQLFMVAELTASLWSFAVDAASGALRLIDQFGIPPTGPSIVQPAGILLTADGRQLFAGLRECNEIIGAAVDMATGKLTQNFRVPSGGATPRDFVLSPDGRQLIVTNQDADRVTVFPVSDGQLGAPLQNLAVGTPMAIAIADFQTA